MSEMEKYVAKKLKYIKHLLKIHKEKLYITKTCQEKRELNVTP